MTEIKRFVIRHDKDPRSRYEWNLYVYGAGDVLLRQWSFMQAPRGATLNACLEYCRKYVTEKGENKFNG